MSNDSFQFGRSINSKLAFESINSGKSNLKIFLIIGVILIIVIISFVFLFFSNKNSFNGGGTSENELVAKQVFKEFVNAGKSGDVYELYRLVLGGEYKIDELKSIEEEYGSLQVEQIGHAFKDVFNQATFNVLDTKIVSEERIDLVVKVGVLGVKSISEFKVVKVDDLWKVDVAETPIDLNLEG